MNFLYATFAEEVMRFTQRLLRFDLFILRSSTVAYMPPIDATIPTMMKKYSSAMAVPFMNTGTREVLVPAVEFPVAACLPCSMQR